MNTSHSRIRSVAFRVDASLHIGTGHAMRCLTLADALKSRGAECSFLCRQYAGNMIEHIESHGHRIYPVASEGWEEVDVNIQNQSGTRHESIRDGNLAHANWLEARQEDDANACATIVRDIAPDWLIVDHYALGDTWERCVGPLVVSLMVIDDLADRPHGCDVLLDQNLGRVADDYSELVPKSCKMLVGPEYALLRPEFVERRSRSLAARKAPRLQNLMISMGGIDSDNATEQVLEALKTCHLPEDSYITVVMGAHAPWFDDVCKQARNMPWPTKVQVNVSNMAALMAEADLAIGAAGSTSWERCCLGLPSLMLVLADNQKFIADHLERHGAAVSLGMLSASESNWVPVLESAVAELVRDPEKLADLSRHAAAIVDGRGTGRIMEQLLVGASK